MANPLGPSAFGAARATTARPSLSPNNAGPDTWFQDCSSPVSRDGTELRSAFLNALLAQLREMIRAGGVAEDNTDEMLLRAIRSQRANFVAASAVGGTANAITLSFDPPFAALADLVGVPIRFLVEANSTSNVSIAVDGLPPAGLHFVNGDPVGAGGLVVGRLVEIVFDGSRFVAFAGVTAAAGHTHPMSDVIGLIAALDGKVSRSGDVMTGNLLAPQIRFGAAAGTAPQGRMAVDAGVAVLDIYAADDSAAKRDLALVPYGGRISIGHVSHAERLDVAGNAIFQGFRPYVDFVDSNAAYAKARLQSSDGGLYVSTQDPQTGLTGRLGVTPEGRVGIGTFAPTERLDVNGNVRAAGSLMSANGIQVSNWFGASDRVLTGGNVAQWRTLAELGIGARTHAAYENRFGGYNVTKGVDLTPVANAGRAIGCTVSWGYEAGRLVATVAFPSLPSANYVINLAGAALYSNPDGFGGFSEPITASSPGIIQARSNSGFKIYFGPEVQASVDFSFTVVI